MLKGQRLTMMTVVWLCAVFGFAFGQEATPSADEIVAKMISANSFWMNLPYKDVSFSYRFIAHHSEKPEIIYVAFVRFKAPDKARLEELVRRLTDKDEERYTIIFSRGEYARISGKRVSRYKPKDGLEQMIAFKMALQFYPASRDFFSDPKRFSVQLLGKQDVNGREAWVLSVKGKHRGRIGTGVAPHITFTGSFYGGDELQLFVDCQNYTLLMEVCLYEGEPTGILEYGGYRRLGENFVPMTIYWTNPFRKKRPDWLNRFEMQIVGGRVWMLKRVFDIAKGRVSIEVTDAKIEPVPDKLFKLPKATPEPKAEVTKRPKEEPKPLTLSGKHFQVHYPKELEAYAKAFIQIGDAAWDAYRELYGLPLPEPIKMHIRLLPERGKDFARLWTDGRESLFLSVGSEEPLKSPEKGGAHNVYGVCHELGHIVIYHRLKHIGEVGNLPKGIAEGWAHYFGSVICSHIFHTLGEQVYPDPHNYHETSGLLRLLGQFERAERKERRGWLGVKLTEEEAKGIVIIKPVTDSPAEKAGLKPKDVIVEFKGVRVKSMAELAKLIAATPPDTEVPIKIVREGKEMTVTAKIGGLVEEWDADLKAAKFLYDIEQRYGSKALGHALNKALEGKPGGVELLPKFAEALTEITGDPNAKTLIPKIFLKPRLIVHAHADITQPKLYLGLKAEIMDKTVQLRYDDGTMEGQRALAGSGHGIFFRTLEGKWQIVAVEFCGCRYGDKKPPEEDFSIFICDEQFEVIREFKAPYRLFPKRDEWKWVKVEIEPTLVPPFFWVVLVFNSTARNGIYVGCDANVPMPHSASALPDFHIEEGPGKMDWMVRIYLKPTDEETAKNMSEAVTKLQKEVGAK